MHIQKQAGEKPNVLQSASDQIKPNNQPRR